MKTKTIKNPGQFPYKKYTHKIGSHKFETNLFPDDGGEITAKIGRDLCIDKYNGKLEEWLDEAMEMSDFYHNLVDFLKEVKYVRGQNNDH